MNSRSFPKNSAKQRRRGFTLVEMLVAVALVSILMTMFAQIFGLASDILSQQRGLASNDQTERTLRTIFRDDLDHRTFKKVEPFESDSTTPLDNSRMGYFHITEGVITDDSDDVLQLTLEKGIDEDPFYGHALTIPGSNLVTDLNQPEFDDEVGVANSVGSSRFAEVTYFLRNNTLYRRVLLIRNPVIGTNVNPTGLIDGSGPPLITGPYTSAPYNREFWSDFDYSAYYYDPTNSASPKFLGAESLDNRGSPTPPPTETIGGVSMPVSFGVPRFRFGFDLLSGQPRRLVTDSSSNIFYIGRFTQQETSDPTFDYPGGNPPTNWYDPTVTLNYDVTNGVVIDLNDGSREAEDVLLRNVHAFDIKVWDPSVSLGNDGQPGVAGVDDDAANGVDDFGELGWPGSDDGRGPDGEPGIAGFDDNGINGIDDLDELGWPESDDGGWFDVGHPGVGGFYRIGANQNQVFGEYPNGGTNGNCFDTWHPTETVGVMPGPNPTGSNPAPYRPELTGTATGNGPQALHLIRIHIRYVDQKSDQMRDAIIIHSLKTE